jgi:hypothetical protein
LLAIIDHVQTNGDLLLYDIDYRSADALRKGSLIQRVTFLTLA